MASNLDKVIENCKNEKLNQQVIVPHTNISYCSIGLETVPCNFADLYERFTKIYDTIMLDYPLCWRHRNK